MYFKKEQLKQCCLIKKTDLMKVLFLETITKLSPAILDCFGGVFNEDANQKWFMP